MKHTHLGLEVKKEEVLQMFMHHMNKKDLAKTPAIAITETVADKAFGGMVEAERYFQGGGYVTKEITSGRHQPVLWIGEHERKIGEGGFLISEDSYKEWHE